MGCAASTTARRNTATALAALEARLDAAEAELRVLRACQQQAQTTIASATSTPGAHAEGATKPASFAPLPPADHVPTDAERVARVITIDAFLSHKQTDAGDLARTLKTELTDVAGLRCFLDQDADFELGDLMSKVRASKTLIFILTEHVFDSLWCTLELREALLWGVDVILLTAHGAKWTIDGRVHAFPPAELIRPEIAKAFANKALEYNRNAHKAVIDQLLQRMYGRPVHAAVASWDVPPQSGEDLARLCVDLSTPESPWRLELPPANPLQTFFGLREWGSRASNDTLVCGLATPFHVKVKPSSGVTSSAALNRFSLCAESLTPYPSEPSRSIARFSYSALVLDSEPHSVQTGLARFQDDVEFSCDAAGGNEHAVSVRFEKPFRSGTMPEVFVALCGLNATARHDERQFILRAKDSDATGCKLVASCSGPQGEQNRHISFDSRLLEVCWLAFDPRLNQSWGHGEVWVTNGTNHREEGSVSVHFASQGRSGLSSGCSPTVAFTTPPQVFVSLGGLVSSVAGFDFAVSVRDVTVSSCTIVWHMWHEYRLPVSIAFAKFGAKLPPPPARPPSKMCIRWLALPAKPTTQSTPATSASAAESL